MRPRNYLILLFLPALVVTGYLFDGWWNFLVPVFCFVAYPVINFFISDLSDYTHLNKIYSSTAYTHIALSFVPVLLILTGFSVYRAGSPPISIISFTGLALSVGMVNSILGFTLAHEFIHRYSKTERVAGYLLLLQNNYLHYGIEHVRGHHVYACTPEDPVTARMHESVYAFLARVVRGTYVSALKIENKKLSGRSFKKPFLHNQMILFATLQIALMVLIYLTMGKFSLLFFLLQNAVAISMLHIMDYLQHYGLIRNENPDGKYEKLNAHHAWNTGRYNKAINLFQLENHADHHIHPGRPFDKLSLYDESPEHPAGYSFMVLLSLIPPLWFKIMDKRILKRPGSPADHSYQKIENIEIPKKQNVCP